MVVNLLCFNSLCIVSPVEGRMKWRVEMEIFFGGRVKHGLLVGMPERINPQEVPVNRPVKGMETFFSESSGGWK
jgi:hypothetical protein